MRRILAALQAERGLASWSLPVLFVHLGTFSVGEIMQD
jgi:hypothetical protein